jgi:hypothetical protein
LLFSGGIIPDKFSHGSHHFARQGIVGRAGVPLAAMSQVEQIALRVVTPSRVTRSSGVAASTARGSKGAGAGMIAFS